MISTTRIEEELTNAINVRYALIQLYIDASIFGYAKRMYRCIKDIMTLYALEKALNNALYYNFDETEVELLIYKIREFIGMINYVGSIDFWLTKYPSLKCPVITPTKYTTPCQGGGTTTTIINNTYPMSTVYIKSITIDNTEWISQDLTPLVTANGQTTIAGLGFNVQDIDIDTIILEVSGDNPKYSLTGDGYHIVGNTLYWHNFYDLTTTLSIVIRWRVE